MSEINAKAQLDQESGESATGFVSPGDIQDAIGIIYDDLEAGDALKLDKSGGTLTGALVLSGDPTLALHPATKQYVDALESDLADYLPLTGGTLTGTVTLNADPMTDLEPATKAYVDDSIVFIVDRLNDELPEGAIGTSLTLTGTLEVEGATTLAASTSIGSVSATEIGYLDGVTSSIQTQIGAKANTAGPTFTGTVTLPTLVSTTTTDSSSSTTGAIKTAGGMGVAKKLYVGTDLNVGGNVTTALSTAGYVTTTSGGLLGSVATIPNAGLTNSAITIGSTSVALGATGATIAGLTLTTPTINTESWTAVADGSLSNSWVNFGSGYSNLSYKKDAQGVVWIRGMIKDGTTATTVYTLPSGYRPPYPMVFNCGANAGVARVSIATSGVIKVDAYYASGTNGFVSLEQIRFAV